MIERLALGTVQFGLAYGIANQAGQPSQGDAAGIVAAARAAGMDTLDTAIAYGESERRLGEIGIGRWRVVTKLPAMPEGVTDVVEWVQTSVDGSLSRLGVTHVVGLLLHRPADLLGPMGAGLADAMRRERAEGRVAKIGVSVYDPSELDATWPILAPDLVQAPFSVVDQRLATSGWLGRLTDAGVEVHARSAFLQGLLLMPRGSRPPRFDRWSELWREWADWVAASGRSPLEVALGHVLAQPGIDRVLVGVDTAGQLAEIVRAASDTARSAPMSLASSDLDLLTPSRWNTL